MRVFLGGTCNGSMWREDLIPLLVASKIDYFNPVVEDWTPECQEREIEERKTCDAVVYTITPRAAGTYAIAEAVDDSNKRPVRTLFCVLDEDDSWGWSKAQRKSLHAVAALVVQNGGFACGSLVTLAERLALMKKSMGE